MEIEFKWMSDTTYAYSDFTDYFMLQYGDKLYYYFTETYCAGVFVSGALHRAPVSFQLENAVSGMNWSLYQ